MAVDLSPEIYSLLVTLVNPTPVQMDVIDESLGDTYVWFERTGLDQELFMNGRPALTTERYAIECVSETIATSQSLANTIRSLHGSLAGLGDAIPIDIILITDQDDSYLPKILWAVDEGLHISSLKMEIIRAGA